MIKNIFLILSIMAFPLTIIASGDHHESHEEEEAEHGHEEGSTKLSPDKGITEASEKLGFKLSPEASKTFALKTTILSKGESWTLPLSAVLYSGEEKNIFRLRDGYYKRIDFTLVKQEKTQITIRSTELKPGDEVVVSSLGFLRIVEIAAFGGAPEGHPH